METLQHMSKSKKIWVMVAVMSAMFLSALDQTVVSTAMATIVKDFDALEHLSWVFTAYMLTSTISVPIYGRLSDIYGRKGFFLASIVIFLAGSALCGLSQSMNQLILFRAVQGIGGGALMTNAFAIIADLWTPEERGRWQGLMGGVFGLASVFGPLLGGWLTDNASWRWAFYINMPLGIVALLAIVFLMPKIKSTIQDKSIDYLGAIYLSLGLTALLLGVTWGGNAYAWNSVEIILLLAFSFVTLTFFASVESFVKNPVLPLELFKNATFNVSIVLVFLMGMGMFGVISFIPLFAQQVIGVSATNSGAIMFPMMGGIIVSSIVGGQLISKFKKYKGLAVMGALITWIAITWLSTMNDQTTQGSLSLKMIMVGIGIGLSMPVLNIAIQNAFDRSKIGVVTASTQLFRSIGGAIGVAVAGSILNAILAKNGGDLGLAIPQTFFYASFFMLLAFVLSLFLKNGTLKAVENNEDGALEEAGIELAVEEGNFSAGYEPRIKRF